MAILSKATSLKRAQAAVDVEYRIDSSQVLRLSLLPHAHRNPKVPWDFGSRDTGEVASRRVTRCGMAAGQLPGCLNSRSNYCRKLPISASVDCPADCNPFTQQHNYALLALGATHRHIGRSNLARFLIITALLYVMEWTDI